MNVEQLQEELLKTTQELETLKADLKMAISAGMKLADHFGIDVEKMKSKNFAAQLPGLLNSIITTVMMGDFPAELMEEGKAAVTELLKYRYLYDEAINTTAG